jgi:hypothetical protein
VIKGEADPKTGMIKGEIGINNPITGYSSIKPFAGSLDKGIGEKIHVLGQDESFSIRKDGNAVKAQLNLNSGGTGIVLFEWESKVQSEYYMIRILRIF